MTEAAQRLSNWSTLCRHLAERSGFCELSPGRAHLAPVIAGTTREVRLRGYEWSGAEWLEVVVVIGSAAAAPIELHGGLAVGAFGVTGEEHMVRHVLPLSGLRPADLDETVFTLARLASDLSQLAARGSASPPSSTAALMEVNHDVVPAELCAAVIAGCEKRFHRGDDCYQHHGTVEALLEPFATTSDAAARELEQLVTQRAADYAQRAGLVIGDKLQLRIARYGAGMSCPLHHDVFAMGTQPTLSAIVNLNADYAGGDLEFVVDGAVTRIDQRVGTFVVFPSVPRYLHRVTPVIDRMRYSLLIWF